MKSYLLHVKEVERDLDLLVEDALPCCAICARIGAWRAIALGLRDLTYEDGVLEVNCSRHREQIEYIQKEILAPLYRSRNELLAEETAAYEAALVEQRYCEKEGFPVLMHLANPAEFWDESKVSDYWKARGCYFDESYPKFSDFHDEILKRMEKNPNLRFSLAHWGFLTYDKQKAEKFMSYKNTVLDVCPGGDNFFNILEDKEYWIPFIEKYADRITYGTDSYNFEYDNEENWLKNTGNRPRFVQDFFLTNTKHYYSGGEFTGIGLKEEYAEKIFYFNLCRILGEPNYINYDYFIEKCDKLLSGESRDTLDGYNLWCMKNDFESMKKGVKL